MKNYIIILLVFCIFSCKAQNENEFEYDNFENQVLSYHPKENAQVSKKDFVYGNMIIKETKSATKNNPENFNLADYFNILSAFLTLKESEKNISVAFEKFKNADGSCEYVLSFENSIKTNPKFDVIRADYLDKLKECKSTAIVEKKFEVEEYCKSNALNLGLVEKINQINIDDQKHRTESSEDLKIKQKELDKKNQEIIDSLYRKHKTYVGESLVGEKFKSVMWAVIQHSNVEMMEKYLPIIKRAVQEKELDVGPLKMLIDRFYGLKYGYQIFGSQGGFGFELADDKKRKELELKYGIE